MLMLMKNAVDNKDTSEKTVNRIRTFLESELRLSPIKLPIKKLAMATLELLGVEKYSNDEEIEYSKAILQYELQ